MGFFSQQDPTKGLDVLSENIKSLGTAAVRNPYQAGIGAVGGLVKGTILDPIAYGVGVPLTGISYAMGKKDFKPLVEVTLTPQVDKLHWDGEVFRDFAGTLVTFENKEYFKNESFTVSYDFVENKWISFHSYQPRRVS